MTWNYRIMRFTRPEASLSLVEVHYDGLKPTGYSAVPATFASDDDPREITKALEMALKDALKHPVLDARVFDMPIEDRPDCPRST